MRRFFFLLPLAAGCAAAEKFDTDTLPTGEQREAELKRNLRSDQTWSEQEQLMLDTKSIFAAQEGADAAGPATKK